jgi:hypothetical protein
MQEEIWRLRAELARLRELLVGGAGPGGSGPG